MNHPKDLHQALAMAQEGASWDEITGTTGVTARELYEYVRPDGPPSEAEDE